MSVTESAVNQFIGELKMARKQYRRNLTVFPLLAPDVGRLFHLSLAEALITDAVTVSEVDGRDGTPGLRLVNRSKKPVLILGNEELPGVRPSRTIGATILLPGMSEWIVPVRCGAIDLDRVVEQPKIGSEVASSTGAMSDIFGNRPDSPAAFRSGFRLVDCQVGAVFAIGAEAVGLELFGQADAFVNVFEKLIAGYIGEALDRPAAVGETTSCPPDKARRLLASTAMANQVIAPAIGWGNAVGLRSRSMTGSALVVNDQLVHLTARCKDGSGCDRVGRPEFFDHRDFIHRESGIQEDRP